MRRVVGLAFLLVLVSACESGTSNPAPGTGGGADAATSPDGGGGPGGPDATARQTCTAPCGCAEVNGAQVALVCREALAEGAESRAREDRAFSYRAGALPERVDHSPRLSAVRSQENWGLCTSFAVVAAIEAFLPGDPAGGERDLSELHAWSHYQKPSTLAAVSALAERKIGTEAALPYDTNSPVVQAIEDGDLPVVGELPAAVRQRAYYGVADFQKLSPDRLNQPDYLQEVLARSATSNIVIGVPWNQQRFERDTPWPGTYDLDGDDALPPAGHAVLVVGYERRDDRLYFIFKNSWGPDWGDRGYGRFSAEYLQHMCAPAQRACDAYYVKAIHQPGAAERSCPDGQRWDAAAGACQPLPQGTCPPHSYQVSERLCECEAGFVPDPAGQTCVPAPQPVQCWGLAFPDPNDDTRCRCPYPLVWEDGECYCPAGATWDEEQQACACPAGTAWDEDQGACAALATDACPVEWYGDGTCDECLGDDPDCEQSVDTCPEAWRGDGACDECLGDDPDCAPVGESCGQDGYCDPWCAADPDCGGASGCGAIDLLGCCDGGLAIWCEEGRLVEAECGAEPCGWVDAEYGYFCGGAGAAPGGVPPLTCSFPAGCTPDCAGKLCGTDGCGGSCGTCGEGELCSYGACEPASDPCSDCWGSSCGAEDETCAANPDCVGLFDCISGCADDPCVEGCAATWPDGIDDFNALVECLDAYCADTCF